MSVYREPAQRLDLLHVAFGDHVFAMNRDTGARLWAAELLPSMAVAVRLCVEGDRVYALGGELVCLDAATGKVHWRAKDYSSAWTMLVEGDHVFVGGPGEVWGLSAATGELLWHEKFPKLGTRVVSLAVVGRSAQVDLGTVIFPRQP
jgi:outer membrane protein assembly factor BamB